MKLYQHELKLEDMLFRKRIKQVLESKLKYEQLQEVVKEDYILKTQKVTHKDENAIIV